MNTCTYECLCMCCRAVTKSSWCDASEIRRRHTHRGMQTIQWNLIKKKISRKFKILHELAMPANQTTAHCKTGLRWNRWITRYGRRFIFSWLLHHSSNRNTMRNTPHMHACMHAWTEPRYSTCITLKRQKKYNSMLRSKRKTLCVSAKVCAREWKRNKLSSKVVIGTTAEI